MSKPLFIINLSGMVAKNKKLSEEIGLEVQEVLEKMIDVTINGTR